MILGSLVQMCRRALLWTPDTTHCHQGGMSLVSRFPGPSTATAVSARYDYTSKNNQMGNSRRTHRKRVASRGVFGGSSDISRRLRELEAEVLRGDRDARTLVATPEGLARKATLTFPEDPCEPERLGEQSSDAQPHSERSGPPGCRAFGVGVGRH